MGDLERINGFLPFGVPEFSWIMVEGVLLQVILHPIWNEEGGGGAGIVVVATEIGETGWGGEMDRRIIAEVEVDQFGEYGVEHPDVDAVMGEYKLSDMN